MKLSIKKSRLGLMTLMWSTLIANADPIGIAGADQNLTITASNTAVLLKATPVPDAVEYKWSEDGTFIGPHMSRWYVINEVGTHTIKLDAYDAAGSVISSDTMNVNVSFANTSNTGILSADAGPETMEHIVTPSNRQIHLVGTATEGTSKIVSEEWFLDDTKIWDGSSFWYTLVTPGEYEFTFKVTAADGSVKSDNITVNVSFANINNTGILSADAGPETMEHIVTPSNRQIHLVGTATEGTSKIVSEEWFLDDTKIWDGSSFWYTLVTPGVYEFTFKVTAADTSVATDTMTVIVDNPDILTADAGLDITHVVTPSNTAIHLNGTATDIDNNIVKYEWFQDGVFIGYNSSRWHVLTEAGTHEFTFKVTDADGHMAEDNMTVTVINDSEE